VIRREKLIPQDPWNPKAKSRFPEHLKPYLKDCGKRAYENGLFALNDDADARFFHALPSILPYNTFTLTVRPCLSALPGDMYALINTLGETAD
jgi:hypothetical protein